MTFLRKNNTGRATTGIAITQQAILRFFAPQGRHDSRSSMKFGMEEGIREYLEYSGPKGNAKMCQNCQLFRTAGANPLSDVGKISMVYACNQSTEIINTWRDSVGKLGIYRQKTAIGHFPQNFWSPLAPKQLIRLKTSRGRVQKWYGHPLSSCKFDGALPLHGGVRNKSLMFLFLFVCFFVCHALDLEQRFSHLNSDIVAICRSIFMRISPFFRKRNSLSNF